MLRPLRGASGAVEQSAYDKWLDQTSAREAGRRDRVHSAAGIIPASLWLVLFLSAVLVFAYMLFFADSAERARSQAMLMGSAATVVVATLLVIDALDHPYRPGLGAIRPVAMERTLDLIEQARTAVGDTSPVPCDADGTALLAVDGEGHGAGGRVGAVEPDRHLAAERWTVPFEASAHGGFAELDELLVDDEGVEPLPLALRQQHRLDEVDHAPLDRPRAPVGGCHRVGQRGEGGPRPVGRRAARARGEAALGHVAVLQPAERGGRVRVRRADREVLRFGGRLAVERCVAPPCPTPVASCMSAASAGRDASSVLRNSA